MLFLRFILTISIFFMLAGCVSDEEYEAMVIKLAPEEVHAEANRIGELILKKDSKGIKEVFHPDGRNETFEADLAVLWQYLPDEALVERRIAGLRYFTQGLGEDSVTSYTFEYQYQFETSWLYLEFVLREEAEELYLTNLRLTPLQGDLSELHAFSLSGASIGQIIMLTALVLNPLFMIATFVVALRMRKKLKSPKRWLGFMLFGLGAIQMNWTTGQMDYQVIKFGLLGGGFVTSGPFAPWILTVYFPVTAILFWTFLKTGRLGLIEPKPLGATEK